MEIEAVQFETVTTTRWAMRVTILGQGIEPRALPLVVLVGDQAAEAISFLFEGNGVSGLLVDKPAPGDVVRIGYADSSLIETDFTYTPPVA
jgi:hypothetical protein